MLIKTVVVAVSASGAMAGIPATAAPPSGPSGTIDVSAAGGDAATRTANTTTGLQYDGTVASIATR